MNLSLRRALLLLPLFAAPLALASWNPTTASLVVEDDTALQGAMGVLKQEQRATKKWIADPVANSAVLMNSIGKMQAAALIAIAERPTAPEGLVGKELGLFHVGYKRAMLKLLDSIVAMEEATLNEDAEALKSAYSSLAGAKKAGHNKYQDA